MDEPNDLGGWDQVYNSGTERFTLPEAVDQINSIIAGVEAFVIEVPVGGTIYTFTVLDAPHRRFSRFSVAAFR